MNRNKRPSKSDDIRDLLRPRGLTFDLLRARLENRLLMVVGRARLERLLAQLKHHKQIVTVFEGPAKEYWLPRHVELKQRKAEERGARGA